MWHSCNPGEGPGFQVVSKGRGRCHTELPHPPLRQHPRRYVTPDPHACSDRKEGHCRDPGKGKDPSQVSSRRREFPGPLQWVPGPGLPGHAQIQRPWSCRRVAGAQELRLGTLRLCGDWGGRVPAQTPGKRAGRQSGEERQPTRQGSESRALGTAGPREGGSLAPFGAETQRASGGQRHLRLLPILATVYRATPPSLSCARSPGGLGRGAPGRAPCLRSASSPSLARSYFPCLHLPPRSFGRAGAVRGSSGPQRPLPVALRQASTFVGPLLHFRPLYVCLPPSLRSPGDSVPPPPRSPGPAPASTCPFPARRRLLYTAPRASLMRFAWRVSQTPF